ncbi:MAG TPA: phosphotransferase [Streptosporangiaceae bacterium]
MSDAAVIGRLLDEYHERSVPPAGIEIVAGSVHEAKVSYKLTLADGSWQLVRAFRADGTVPTQSRGPFTETLPDWLLGRAETLAALAAAGYRAPRPVLTRTGELIAVAGPWLAWATAYVPGAALEPTLGQLRALGETLGGLHSVIAGGGGRRLAPRHPAVAVPATLSRLDALADRVPRDWEPMCAAFRRTVLAVDAAASLVPETLVHGDAWARNAVQVDDDGLVTLIDWETSGLGLAVVDLGSCLLDCHLDSAVADSDPEAWLISPDEDRIAATAAGYASVRALSAAEVELLPDAVRFSTAVAGAIHVELALADGVTGPTMDGRLVSLENRLSVADEVAALAAPYLS